MPRITKAQKAGLDFLNQIVFNELVIHRGMDAEERLQIQTLTARVAQMAERQHSGIEAEIIKHVAYCLLELHLATSLDDLRQASPGAAPPVDVSQSRRETYDQHNQKYQKATILALYKTATDATLDSALEICATLKDEFAGYSALVRRDLVNRCFVQDCSEASLRAYCWLVSSRVLPVTKADPDPDNCNLSAEFMMRLTLLANHEMVSHELKKTFSKGHFARVYFDQPELNLSKKRANNLVESLNAFTESNHKPTLRGVPLLRFDSWTTHKHVQRFFLEWGMRKVGLRIHTGTLAAWLSLVGAGMIDRQAALNSPPLEGGLTSSSDGKMRVTAIYSAFDNTGTISESASLRLAEYGLTVHADTLYRTHSMMRKTIFPALTAYCETMRDVGLVLPPYEDDYLYLALFMRFD